jgi:ferredoxin
MPTAPRWPASAADTAMAPAPASLDSTGAFHRLTVLPGAWQAPVAAQQSLLQAARAAGVALPSACRNGSCRACLCRLVSGSIHYQIDWPGLLAEEKAEGWILPCVATASSDVVIDAPAAKRLVGA